MNGLGPPQILRECRGDHSVVSPEIYFWGMIPDSAPAISLHFPCCLIKVWVKRDLPLTATPLQVAFCEFQPVKMAVSLNSWTLTSSVSAIS